MPCDLGNKQQHAPVRHDLETIRRFHQRGPTLYEVLQDNRNFSRHHKRNPHGRDISEYHVNEPAPTEDYVQNIFAELLAVNAQRPGILATLRNYFCQWARWLKLGLSTLTEFATCVQTYGPTHLFMLDAQVRGFFLGITSLISNSGSQTSMKITTATNPRPAMGRALAFFPIFQHISHAKQHGLNNKIIK